MCLFQHTCIGWFEEFLYNKTHPCGSESTHSDYLDQPGDSLCGCNNCRFKLSGRFKPLIVFSSLHFVLISDDFRHGSWHLSRGKHPPFAVMRQPEDSLPCVSLSLGVATPRVKNKHPILHLSQSQTTST